MKRHGFTLVEILVALAIMGILVAILFPVFNRVRENGRRTACQSNLKQIGLGFLQYAQDFGDKLPPAATPPNQRRFHELVHIYAYTKSEQILVCPTDSTGKDDDSAFKLLPLSGSTPVLCSYLTTWSEDVPKGTSAHWGVFGYGGVAVSSISAPTETIAVTEGMMTPASHGYLAIHIGRGRATPTGPGSQDADDYVTRRHNGGANYLFADGHVKWFTRANSEPDALLASGSPNDQTAANATINGVHHYYFWRNGVSGKS